MQLQGGKREPVSGPSGKPESALPSPDATESRQPTAEPEETDSVSSFVATSEVKQGTGDIRPFAQVTLFGANFRALLDTGAVINLIGDRVVQHLLDNGLKPGGVKVVVRMVDGTQCPAGDRFWIRGSIAGRPHRWPAYHVPHLTTDVVLGMRCLRDLDLVHVNVDPEPPSHSEGPSGWTTDQLQESNPSEPLGCATERVVEDNPEPAPERTATATTSTNTTDNQGLITREATGDPGCSSRSPTSSNPGEVLGCGTSRPIELSSAGLERSSVDKNLAAHSDPVSQFLSVELPKFDTVRGKTTLVEHVIRLKDNVVPVKQRYYPRNPAMQKIINDEVETMLDEGIIEPSDSPWSSPVVLIKKSTGKYRFCIDMRKVNDASIKDAYPLPRINAILEKLRKAKYITTLDLKQGYWQVPLALESRPITAFTVPGLGLFQFKVMPFGLHSAGATFQRLLDRVIGPELEPKAFAYLDDLVVVSTTLPEHFDLLRVVFHRLREAGLRLNPEKCQFAKRELKYLGHVVNSRGIATDPEKVRAIQEFPTPSNVKALRSFLGLASWYRRFVEGFAKIAAPLRTLLKKDAKWEWGPQQANSFDELKRFLCTTPILACPDFNLTFTVQVDASNSGLGAALTQEHGGKEVVIAYASRLLSDPERNYSTTEKECLALVWAVRKFKPYLEGYHFKAITDHVALRWLMKLHEPSGRLARWVMELQQYDFEVKYRKGTLNRVADALSRQSVTEVELLNAETDPSTLEAAILTADNSAPAGAQAPDEVLPGGEERVVETAEEENEADWYDRMFEAANKQHRKFPNFRVWSGKLYRSFLNRRSRKTEWKVCVPNHQVNQVLQENHDVPTAGHLGVKKTVARVGAGYFWPHWRQDVKMYVRSCTRCQEYKVEQRQPAGKMHFRRPQGPWYTVSADLVGPLPRSPRGHKFLLVLQDTFSKWTELVAIGSATARNVTNKTKEVLLRYGAPEVILTDNGTQFTSKIFSELAADWGVTFQNTAPYSPQSNPVERANRVVKTMIAQFVRDKHKTWDHHLFEFQYALNTAVHDSTGYTPAMLCFGRELRAPGAIRGPTVETTDDPEDSALLDIHSKRMSEFKLLYEQAQRNLAAAYQRQSKYYNLRRREVNYRIGDLVMRRLHILSSAAEAISGKLAPKFHGPCEVKTREGRNMYEVKDQDSGQRHIVHVKDLKPFYGREEPATPGPSENL